MIKQNEGLLRIRRENAFLVNQSRLATELCLLVLTQALNL